MHSALYAIYYAKWLGYNLIPNVFILHIDVYIHPYSTTYYIQSITASAITSRCAVVANLKRRVCIWLNYRFTIRNTIQVQKLPILNADFRGSRCGLICDLPPANPWATAIARMCLLHSILHTPNEQRIGCKNVFSKTVFLMSANLCS